MAYQDEDAREYNRVKALKSFEKREMTQNTVIDDYNREGLNMDITPSLSSFRVIWVSKCP